MTSKLTWSVKRSGKLQTVILADLILLAVVMAYTIPDLLQHVSLEDWGIASLGMAAGMFPVWIAVLATPPLMIQRKKIAKAITIDPTAGQLQVEWFGKKPAADYPLSSLAGCVYRGRLGVILVLVHKSYGRKGNPIYKQVMTVTGSRLSMSWREKEVVEIANALYSCGVEEYRERNARHYLDLILD